MKTWQKLAAGGALAAAIMGALTGTMEGTRYTPYRDVGGVGTACEGVTHGIDMRHTYTPAECSVLDQRERAVALAVVERTLRQPATEAQKAAFGDFIYNEGAGTWQQSSMLRDFNEGKANKACGDLMLYVCVRTDTKNGAEAGGLCYSTKRPMRFVRGLQVRRQYEYELCMQGVH